MAGGGHVCGQSEVGKARWAERGHRQGAKRNFERGRGQTQSEGTEGTAMGGGHGHWMGKQAESLRLKWICYFKL